MVSTAAGLLNGREQGMTLADLVIYLKQIFKQKVMNREGDRLKIYTSDKIPK